MKVVVPLAGPDFELPNGSVKAEHPVSNEPLLRNVLERRPWWQSGLVRDSDLVFVMRDSPRVRAFATGPLASWYPAARQVLISATTGGAALSALAGVSLIADAEAPLCVDLVDIGYRSTLDVPAALAASGAHAIALVFSSTNPLYSYLRTDERGRVVEAAEKRVISSNASAGTYIFASPAVYLNAIAHNLDRRHEVMHKGFFFVCPLYNGVLAAGGRVILEFVEDVVDIKTN